MTYLHSLSRPDERPVYSMSTIVHRAATNVIVIIINIHFIGDCLSRPLSAFFLLSSMDTDWDPVLQLVADPADADYKLTDRQPFQLPTPPVSTSILSRLHP